MGAASTLGVIAGMLMMQKGYYCPRPTMRQKIQTMHYTLRQCYFLPVTSYPEKMRKIQDHGIEVYGTFIVGLDEDDCTIFS